MSRARKGSTEVDSSRIKVEPGTPRLDRPRPRPRHGLDWRLARSQAGARQGGLVSRVLSRLRPPPQGRSRSVRSSDTRARAGVRLVSSRGLALRHTREGDEKDVRDRAGVEDVIHFARSLDERLPRAVRGGPALVADR